MKEDKIRLTHRQAGMAIFLLIVIIGGAVAYFAKSGEESRTDQVLRISEEKEVQDQLSPENSDTNTTANANASQILMGVHVTVAVHNPDQVYFLPEGSRVQDAIEAAGGALQEADLSKLNLARYLTDSEQIRVPFEGEEVAEDLTPGSDGASAQSAESATKGLTNINSADKIELMELPGIGEVMAEKIIRYREENGPFGSIEDLQNVPGIGSKKFDELKGCICVN